MAITKVQAIRYARVPQIDGESCTIADWRIMPAVWPVEVAVTAAAGVRCTGRGLARSAELEKGLVLDMGGVVSAADPSN